MRLKVADDFLDMDNSIIAQTYAVNEIGSLETRQGGFSNDFTIPLTSKNKDILGFPNEINSASRNPYIKFDVTLFDKSEPIADGYLRFQIVDDIILQASFFADNVNWFNLIKGKSIKELDFVESDHIWNPGNVSGSFTNTEGYIYPFIDYNGFQAEATSPGVVLVDRENWLPAVFVHTIIEKIFFEAGWKVIGDLVNLPIYQRSLIPFSSPTFDHPAQWITDNSLNDTATVPHAITTVRSEISWVTAGSNVIVWTNESAVVTLKIVLQLASSGGIIDVNAQVGGPGALTETVSVTPTGTEEFTFLFDRDSSGRQLTINNTVEDPGNDEIRVGVQTQSGTGTVSAVSTIEVIPTGEYTYFTSVDLEDVLPDIQQTDFINFFSFAFGGILQANPNSKTVTWSLFRDVKGNLANALDWSDKLDLSKTKEVNFTELLNNYAKNSILTYEAGQNDTALADYLGRNGERFGQGSYNIDNEHLPGKKTIFEAPFASTINQLNPQTSEVVAASIPHYVRSRDSGTGIVTRLRQATGFRVLILSDGLISVSDLTFNTFSSIGSTPSVIDIPYCWFEKSTFGITALDEDLNTYAFELSNIVNGTGASLKARFLEDYEDTLNSMKFLKAFFLLNEVDITELDFILPIFIDRFKAYFYISKIEDYRGSNRTTKAELTKIS